MLFNLVGKHFRSLSLLIILTTVGLFCPKSPAADCGEVFNQDSRFSFRTETIDGIPVRVGYSKHRIDPFSELPNSSYSDVVVVFTGGHVKILFEGKPYESMNGNHLVRTAGEARPRGALEGSAGIFVRIRGLKRSQIEALRAVMDGKRVCRGFTCAQVADQALTVGHITGRSLNVIGTFTMTGLLKKLARLQIKTKAQDSVRVDIYSAVYQLSETYRVLERNDKYEIDYAKKNLLRPAAAGGSMVAVIVGALYFLNNLL